MSMQVIEWKDETTYSRREAVGSNTWLGRWLGNVYAAHLTTTFSHSVGK